MGETTSIAWTDKTFNPWWGCTEVSPACDNCYARDYSESPRGQGVTKGLHVWGKDAPRHLFGEHHWKEPLSWDRKAQQRGTRYLVFCGSMCDILDPVAPDSERTKLWELIRKTPNLIWQLLTKRPQNYKHMVPEDILGLPRVWPGTTVENQEWADVRIPAMLQLYCAGVRWLSMEPLLTAVDLWSARYSYGNAKVNAFNWGDGIKWVIVGGESGKHLREFKPQWAEAIRGECRAGDAAFFMKQMSARTPAAAARLIPADLNIREFPAIAGRR